MQPNRSSKPAPPRGTVQPGRQPTMKLSSLSLFLLLAAATASTAKGGWIDMQGNPVPESDASRSREGFSATILITADQDWQEKWNTPPETIPHFSTTSEVGSGGELFVLTFLANPMVDKASGMTDVVCDFIVLRPDGSDSTRELDMPCFKVELRGNPRSVYLSSASLRYVEEPSDPRGTWTVMVTVKDRLRGVDIPLRSSFVVRQPANRSFKPNLSAGAVKSACSR